MFLAIKPELYPILIALLVVFVPTFILAMFCFIRLIIKASKRNKQSNKLDDGFYDLYFGGKENVKKIEVNMSRVIVEVANLDLVNLEGLKLDKIGVLINGNVVSCSSQKFADEVSKNLK